MRSKFLEKTVSVFEMSRSLENNVLTFLEQKKGLKHNTLSACDNCSFPSLSVGICVRNSEATFGECLNSVVTSDYEKSKLQIVIVDGNSTDRTLDIADDILRKSDIDFKVLSDEGKGLGYARQLVVDNANGKYICWIDGDNILPRMFLKEHVKFAEKNNNVSLFTPIILFKGKQLLTRLEGYYWLLPTLNAVGTNKMPRLAMQGTLTPVAELKKLGGFDTSITGAGEDTALFLRMKQNGNLFMVNPNARIYHVMRSSWKSLYKQISWWAKTQPRLPKLSLFKQVSMSIITTLKQSPLIIAYFKDPIGIFMPMYVSIWNGWYFLHSLS